MQKAPHLLVSLFDANPEHSHFESPILARHARALGKALGQSKIGIIARIGSPVVATVFESLFDLNTPSIALSPATSRFEHEKAYRLPFVSTPLVFTGKGALGADMVALSSGEAVIIFGSYAGVLENILEQVKDSGLPVGVLSDEAPSDIHERVRALYPHLTAHLFVSHDSAVLVREVADELRRKHLKQ